MDFWQTILKKKFAPLISVTLPEAMSRLTHDVG
jgi:hypothetical protein